MEDDKQDRNQPWRCDPGYRRKRIQADRVHIRPDPRVLTHLELDARIMAGGFPPDQTAATVFIQCVGSREPMHPYCSRVCCTHTMESAIHLRQTHPEMDVYVLYRDIRTYGEREDLYTQARREGVIFFRYEEENKPKVKSPAGESRYRNNSNRSNPAKAGHYYGGFSRTGDRYRAVGNGSVGTIVQGAHQRRWFLCGGPPEAPTGGICDRGGFRLRDGTLPEID